MKVQITHPVETEGDRLLPGAVVDVPEEQALEWIANEWAYLLPEHYGAQGKPELRHDDEIYKRGRRKSTPAANAGAEDGE